MATLANLDQHLADAGYKLLRVDRNVISPRPLPDNNNNNNNSLRCIECCTPIQSDDFGGLCSGCHNERNI